MIGDCVTLAGVPLERTEEYVWDGVGWETVDQGTLETGQSFRHICAKGGGEKIERSMGEAVGGGRGLGTARRGELGH